MKNKVKTNRSAAKRFSFTATGKIKRTRAYRRHLLTGRKSKRMRSLKRSAIVHKTDFRKAKRMLPNG